MGVGRIYCKSSNIQTQYHRFLQYVHNIDAPKTKLLQICLGNEAALNGDWRLVDMKRFNIKFNRDALKVVWHWAYRKYAAASFSSWFSVLQLIFNTIVLNVNVLRLVNWKNSQIIADESSSMQNIVHQQIQNCLQKLIKWYRAPKEQIRILAQQKWNIKSERPENWMRNSNWRQSVW